MFVILVLRYALYLGVKNIRKQKVNNLLYLQGQGMPSGMVLILFYLLFDIQFPDFQECDQQTSKLQIFLVGASMRCVDYSLDHLH